MDQEVLTADPAGGDGGGGGGDGQGGQGAAAGLLGGTNEGGARAAADRMIRPNYRKRSTLLNLHRVIVEQVMMINDGSILLPITSALIFAHRSPRNQCPSSCSSGSSF